MMSVERPVDDIACVDAVVLVVDRFPQHVSYLVTPLAVSA